MITQEIDNISYHMQAPKPYNSLAYISDRVPSTPALEQKHYSSNDQINKYLDGTLESSQDSSTSTEGIKTVTILDYAEPLSPTRDKGTFPISAADPCGDGSNHFATESGGVRRQTFPVLMQLIPRIAAWTPPQQEIL